MMKKTILLTCICGIVLAAGICHGGKPSHAGGGKNKDENLGGSGCITFNDGADYEFDSDGGGAYCHRKRQIYAGIDSLDSLRLDIKSSSERRAQLDLSNCVAGVCPPDFGDIRVVRSGVRVSPSIKDMAPNTSSPATSAYIVFYGGDDTYMLLWASTDPEAPPQDLGGATVTTADINNNGITDTWTVASNTGQAVLLKQSAPSSVYFYEASVIVDFEMTFIDGQVQ